MEESEGIGEPKRLAFWSEAFVDYERSTKEGSQTQRTAGGVLGVDTSTRLGDGNLRFGAIGGYTVFNQRTKTTEISDGEAIVSVSVGPRDADGNIVNPVPFLMNLPNLEREIETDLRRRFRAVNGGLTASYSQGRFFIDTVARLESASLSQRGTRINSRANLVRGLPLIFSNTGNPVYGLNGELIQNRPDGNRGCLDYREQPRAEYEALTPEQRAEVNQDFLDARLSGAVFSSDTESLDGNTSSLSFILANTMGVSYELGNGFLFEPTFSYRYIYTDYARSAAALGLDDGRALRLEAGGKVSHINVSRNGTVWINSVGLYAYSDVMVKGFVIASDGSAVDSDEGEIRGRAVLQSRLQMPNGVSYYGEVNGRFGDQYWGVGGKLGMRIEW